MRSQILAVSALLAVATGVVAQQQPAPSPLPVKRVTLFSSGVAYVERTGQVEGNATVPLSFRTGQINDILKSMVLLDERGQVRPATYTARDPVSHTLQAFAVDVSQPTTLAELLNRLRGATATVETTKGAITGQIVSVEERQVAGADGKPITVPFLNLLADSGLVSIKLDAEKSVKLTDERLNRELREALGLLATGMDDQRKQVMLHFAGQGARNVRVGYVTEAPLWKMSYRLVLENAGKPYLQGWAMVENTTDEDWTDIRLSLISGRPVSFIEDLYQPLYIPRPVVPPDVVASPYPQTHAGNMLDEKPRVAEAAPPANGPAGPAGEAAGLGANMRRSSAALGRAGGAGGGGFGGGGLGGGRSNFGSVPLAANGTVAGYNLDNAIVIPNSVAAEAAGQKAGELFKYDITTPVTLPRQQAAMIPVVAQDIETEKLSLYNADSGKFPLNAVRIKNTTGLHLKGGPITLFDEGVYAGDARMEDIPPADSRLVTYAVDLNIEGERQNPSSEMFDMAMSLKRGVLTVTRKEKSETTYTLKSKSDKARNVLVEHPFNAAYKLVTPEKATERTPQVYRFVVAVPAGKSQTLKVVTERPISLTVEIMNSDLTSLAVYANKKEISQKLRETLQEVVQRRRKLADLRSQADERDAEIKQMTEDQDRIRKNMAALDHASALYKRYVTELDAQETKMQTLRTEAANLRAQAAAAERDLKAYVDGITIAE